MSPIHLLSLQIALAFIVTRVGGSLSGRSHVHRTIGEWTAGILFVPLLQLAAPRASVALFSTTSLPTFELIGRLAVLAIVFLSVVSWRRRASLVLCPGFVRRAVGWALFALACIVARTRLPPVPRATLAAVTIGYVVLFSGAAAYVLRRVEAHAVMRGRIGEQSLGAILTLIAVSAWLAWWLGVPPELGAAELALALPTSGWLPSIVDAQLDSLIRVVLIPVLLVCIGLHLQATALSEVARWLIAAPLALTLGPSMSQPRREPISDAPRWAYPTSER